MQQCVQVVGYPVDTYCVIYYVPVQGCLSTTTTGITTITTITTNSHHHYYYYYSNTIVPAIGTTITTITSITTTGLGSQPFRIWLPGPIRILECVSFLGSETLISPVQDIVHSIPAQRCSFIGMEGARWECGGHPAGLCLQCRCKSLWPSLKSLELPSLPAGARSANRECRRMGGSIAPRPMLAGRLSDQGSSTMFQWALSGSREVRDDLFTWAAGLAGWFPFCTYTHTLLTSKVACLTDIPTGPRPIPGQPPANLASGFFTS